MSVNQNKIIVKIDSELQSIVPEYLASLQKNIEQMKTALKQSDFNAIQRLGHGMKGSGGGYGFDMVTEYGFIIESAANAGNGQDICDCLEKLSDYLKAIDIAYE